MTSHVQLLDACEYARAGKRLQWRLPGANWGQPVVKVTFIDHKGERRTVNVRSGSNLMEVARCEDIPGILAECGGACACATCRVFVDPAWTAFVGQPDARETAMLDMAVSLQDNARLACQVTLVPALDGLIVRTPERQH